MVKTKFMFTVQVKDKTYSVILGQNLKNQAIVDIRTIWLFTDWTVRNVASMYKQVASFFKIRQFGLFSEVVAW